MKKGRFSKDDIKFIEANAELLSFDQIASQLDRDPTSVRDWISKNIGFDEKEKKEATGVRLKTMCFIPKKCKSSIRSSWKS